MDAAAAAHAPERPARAPDSLAPFQFLEDPDDPTDGFEMVLNDRQVVELDVTLHSKSWQSADGQVQLDYLVTWQSDTDSGGLFYLTVPRDLLDAKDRLTVEVRSRGSGSQRWFALDDVKTAKQTERLILDALKPDGE